MAGPILLLGKNGQLGWELQRTLAQLGAITAIDREEVDLSRPEQLREVIAAVRPAVIVNASAFTDVDRAETASALVNAINVDAPAILAVEARRLGAPFIHFSTDFVFDGAKGSVYTEADQPNPLNAYGRSKLAGERAVQAAGGGALIFRTSWVYSLRGNGFVSKVLRWARQHESLRIVADQVGSPTWARTLAELTTLVLAKSESCGPGWLAKRAGLYHVAGEGAVSRLDWARAILELDPAPREQRCKALEPAKSADFPAPAERPVYSALHCGRFMSTFGLVIPPWKDCLRLAMDTSVFNG